MADAENDPAAARPDPPPLRIAHFLLWTAVAGVAMALLGNLFAGNAVNASDAFDTFESAYIFFSELSYLIL